MSTASSTPFDTESQLFQTPITVDVPVMNINRNNLPNQAQFLIQNMATVRNPIGRFIRHSVSLEEPNAENNNEAQHSDSHSTLINMPENDDSSEDSSNQSQQQSAGPEMQQHANLANLQNSIFQFMMTVYKSLEGVLPFILLVFAKVMYDHRLGILIFIGFCISSHYANAKMKKVATERSACSSVETIEVILFLAVFLSVNIFLIYYFFNDQQLYAALYFVLPKLEHVTLWELLWVTGTTDFVLKFGTILLKLIIAAIPAFLMAFKSKGRFYMVIEGLSQFYRSLLPIVPWFYFLTDKQYGGPWFALVLIVLYAVAKGFHLLQKYRELKDIISKFVMNRSFGSPPGKCELESCDNICPICHEKLQAPTMLTCKHVYCEDCVALWFDRERTCPLCRATITDNPQWRDGTTCQSLLVY